MGLITTYDDRNKVTDRGLAIRYSSEPVIELSTSYYLVTRYATKTYSYVGMDYKTAAECASAKRAQYTRNYATVALTSSSTPPVSSETSSPTSPVTSKNPVVIYVKQCLADIAPQRTNGDMWDVVLQINETDVKFSYDNPDNLEFIFEEENRRNYDETGGGSAALTLNSVSRSGTRASISYSTNIANIDRSRLMLIYKTSESGNSTGVLPNPDGTYTVLNQKLWCMIAFGNYTSNTVQSN